MICVTAYSVLAETEVLDDLDFVMIKRGLSQSGSKYHMILVLEYDFFRKKDSKFSLKKTTFLAYLNIYRTEGEVVRCYVLTFDILR